MSAGLGTIPIHVRYRDVQHTVCKMQVTRGRVSVNAVYMGYSVLLGSISKGLRCGYTGPLRRSILQCGYWQHRFAGRDALGLRHSIRVKVHKTWQIPC